jgi:hypothetical protein
MNKAKSMEVTTLVQKSETKNKADPDSHKKTAHAIVIRMEGIAISWKQ